MVKEPEDENNDELDEGESYRKKEKPEEDKDKENEPEKEEPNEEELDEGFENENLKELSINFGDDDTDYYKNIVNEETIKERNI